MNKLHPILLFVILVLHATESFANAQSQRICEGLSRMQNEDHEEQDGV